MITHPAYYQRVRDRATARWDQLEQDPELAGPWHQLFKQVQSPRHILSELLQNADDAGATEASARIEGSTFLFEHNGDDFSEEHFASLCRFGYSNKRALHTIGFRGIGFKSTFSLGDWVELRTPTLSVRFHKNRFTEPHWFDEIVDTDGKTCVRVAIRDELRQREVAKNLEEWLKSPVSLLFFHSIRRLQIGERELHWGSMGPGPVDNSEWMALHDKPDEAVLVVRSEPDAFPTDALTEIEQERMITVDEAGDYPPCRVDLVLGAPGRLYVVLPTGVSTELPFACNGPFIQDPARLKIKDPETSPTNRWLLERAGRLAAVTMLGWLRTSASTNERAGAYALMPDVDRTASSLEGVCAATVEEAFAEGIAGEPVLLTEQGDLVEAGGAIAIPSELLAVWPEGQAAALLDDERRPALCGQVDVASREKFQNWNVVDEVDRGALLAILQGQHLPAPKTWRQLLDLWAFVAPALNDYRWVSAAPQLRIMPVQGRDVLYSAKECVRIGEKKLLQSEEDWEFLAQHLIVLNQNWPRFLADQRRLHAEGTHGRGGVEAAYSVLQKCGFSETSDVSKVMAGIAAQFFEQPQVTLADAVRMAQVAAALNANVAGSFRFVTADCTIRPNVLTTLVDLDGQLCNLLPPARRDGLLLHPDYSAASRSCSEEEWRRWIAAGYAGLKGFVPIVRRRLEWYSRSKLEAEAKRREYAGELYYPYVTNHFVLEDWDFEEEYWKHWRGLAKDEDNIWVEVLTRILEQRDDYWANAKSARILQVATTGRSSIITHGQLFPSWLLRLRELSCLKDRKGFVRKPGELLRRTPETEALLDVEPFVDARIDREAARSLLDLLGVRSTPTGPERALDCLQALAKASQPPIHEVEKWYRRLDQMMTHGGTEDAELIQEAFQSERLIHTQDGAWVDARSVFLFADEEDAPGAAIVRESMRDLALWRRVGVADRPSADLALAWLRTIPPGEVLSNDDARRVRALLVRYSARIWYDCGHWLNLAGEWAPTKNLTFALTTQSLVRYLHLHPWVKQQTADLQRLPTETLSGEPFSRLPLLAGKIEDRLHDASKAPNSVPCDWLNAVGEQLARVEMGVLEETDRIRTLARRLARTRLVRAAAVEVVPYIDGAPAGTARSVDLVWLDELVHVTGLSNAKLAKRLPEEIGKRFAHADIAAALNFCFGRTLTEVRDYMAENFDLAEIDEAAIEHVVALQAVDDMLRGSARSLAPSLAAEPLIDTQIADAVEELGLAAVYEESSANGHAATPRPRASSQPTKPALIDRFAKLKGFRRDGDGRYFRDDGGWLARVSDSPFAWEYRSATGDTIARYWVKDHCLERESLQVDAEVWRMIDRQPDSHVLLLAGPDDAPVEYCGKALRAMCDAEIVKLYPATYRLVMSDDRQDR